MNKKLNQRLMRIYRALYSAFGPQHWWPGDTPFEIIIGAILVQNTSWQNVEKAISNLKRENLLSPQKLLDLRPYRLARLIKSAGYFNMKAKRIKHFMDFLSENYSGNLDKMFSEEIHNLREKLLKINGIGKETADSIILYAAGKPSFVVDAYTKRIFARLRLISEDADYDQMKTVFQRNLSEDVLLFNEYHALLVHLGKNYCRPKPQCQNCPLKDFRHKNSFG